MKGRNVDERHVPTSSAGPSPRRHRRYGRGYPPRKRIPRRRSGHRLGSSAVTIDPLVLLTDVDRATERLCVPPRPSTPTSVGAPSLLPGWTVGPRAHPRGAQRRRLINLLTWARTGVETPMYASPAGPRRPASRPAPAGRCAEQIDDLRDGPRALRRRRRRDAGRGLDVRPAGRTGRPPRRCRGPGCARSRCTTSTSTPATPPRLVGGVRPTPAARDRRAAPPTTTPAMVLRPSASSTR